MPNLIQLLPDHVANQIAAGEVIQRPASVIKELVENAIDAGATVVKVVVKDAGKTLIQVIDNGCGMNDIDARMAFERHATSKIKSADDIFHIFTKGFRGEALASIAAVAQVELKTRMVENELGTKIIIEGSEVKSQETIQCPAGTSFAIKNLFFNTPARRNFLKNDNSELKHIIEEFLRVALVHSDVECRLNHNENDIFILPASNARQRIVSAFGKSFNEKLVPVEQETVLASIKGFVCKPAHAKKTRGEQYFFVNNRFIKSNYLNHAVASAYDDMIDKGSFPSYFIFLTVDPASIDINIHPTKTEIKFQDEKSLYSLLNAAVKQSLGMYNIVPSLDFSSITEFDLTPVQANQSIKIPQVKVDTSYNPFQRTSSGSNLASTAVQQGIPAKQWEELYRIQKEFDIPVEKEMPQNEPASEQLSFDEQSDNNYLDAGTCIQVNGKYLLTNIKSGVLLIDQQRAHERVLYEQFLSQLEAQKPLVQTQMFPEQVELSPGDYALLLDLIPHLNNTGLSIENFGNNTVVVNGLPAQSNENNPKAFVETLLEQMKNHRGDARLNTQEKLALSLARSSGIKAGKKLSQQEMKHLLHELFTCRQPHFTPKGKAVIVTFTQEEIANKFD